MSRSIEGTLLRAACENSNLPPRLAALCYDSRTATIEVTALLAWGEIWRKATKFS